MGPGLGVWTAFPHSLGETALGELGSEVLEIDQTSTTIPMAIKTKQPNLAMRQHHNAEIGQRGTENGESWHSTAKRRYYLGGKRKPNLCGKLNALAWRRCVRAFLVQEKCTMGSLNAATVDFSNPPETSAEQRGTTKNDAVHTIPQVLQRWDQRLTLENSELIQRYKKGEVQILLEFSTRIIPKEYVVVFQGKPHIGNAQYPRVRFRICWEQFGIQARQVDSHICSRDGDRQTVFVDNTQAVQTPEGISLPSAIWFDSADRIYSVLPHSFYLSKSFGPVSRGCFGDRKIDLTGAPGISSKPQCASEVIQGRSEILNGIPSDCRDHRIDWLYVRNAIRRSALMVNLAGSFVWPTLQENIDCCIQIRDVMVGPLDFDED